MRQQFFAKTIQSDFIKSLLYNTPLPICNCVTMGDYLIKGHSYIYNRQLIRCTANGYLKPELLPVQIYTRNTLGIFILGYSTLGIAFNGSISKVAYGGYIFKNKYYLLGEYDLNYEDQTYSRFSSSQSYSRGDIVIHQQYDHDYLYVALDDLTPGVWNNRNWQYILSVKGPYQLILCTESGVIGDRPAGATFTVVQDFEPAEVSYANYQSDYHYLSGDTYYIVVKQDPNKNTSQWDYILTYNGYSGYLEDSVAQYDVVESYIPEQYYRLNTQRFLSPYDYYDSTTHKELGRLLRFYRSVYDLDLLPYYNCWDGSYMEGFVITDRGIDETSSTTNKLIRVPIKFNKKYTIAIDCNSEVRIVPIFSKLNDLLTVKLGIGNEIDLSEQFLIKENLSISKYNQLSFTKPVVYSVPNTSTDPLSTIEGSVGNVDVTVSEFFQRYESDLYLIIQVPATNDSSIVVLEGDFTSINTTNIFDMQHLKSLSQQQFNDYLLSDLSLLMLNDRVSYPFADRLVEYLLDNVITNKDEIGEDIIRIRQKLNGSISYDANSVAWDEYLRKTIYDLYMNSSKTSKLDISGFVDKDVEQFINLL